MWPMCPMASFSGLYYIYIDKIIYCINITVLCVSSSDQCCSWSLLQYTVSFIYCINASRFKAVYFISKILKKKIYIYICFVYGTINVQFLLILLARLVF